MSALIHEIQAIRSLRNSARNQPLIDAITKAIGMIHQSIASSSDSQSTKKSDWRGHSSSQGFRGSSSSNASSSSSASSSRGNFFGNNARPHQGDNRRFRNNAPAREVISVPLDNRTPLAEPVKKADEDGFETVRRTNRPYRRGGNDHSRVQVESPSSSSTASATPAASSDPVVFRSHPPQKYVSRFRKESDKVEDIILNKILLGKLNKFSPSNYPEIKEFITHIIDNGETEMIKHFMKLVFEKAASEEMFCPLYARLLSELSAKYPILLDEMKNLYAKYMAIFEEVPTAGDPSDESYLEFCQRNIEKSYRRGYSQFLAELIKYNVIDMDVFIKTVSTIIHKVELNVTNKESIKLVEEYADCMGKIVKAIKMKSAVKEETDDEEDTSDESIIEIRRILKTDFMDRFQPLTIRQVENVGLSNKARFTFLDIYEEIQRFTI